MNEVSPIQAVIFDFDGVIADTEPLHYAAFCKVAATDGLDCSWEEYVRDYIGYDDRDLFRAAYRKSGRALDETELRRLVQTKATTFNALTADGVATYAGIPDLVHKAADRYPVGLCSGALRSDIDPILAQLNLTKVFQVVVTAEDVPESKPDPACYRLTVRRLAERTGQSLTPADCLAIEDTPGGIRSAKGAGVRVWAVTHTHEASDIDHADRVFDSLHEVRHALDEQ